MLKKIILATTAIAFLSASSMAMAKKIEIEFMTGAPVDAPLYQKYKDVTKKFEDLHPGVTIDLEPTSTDHEGEVKSRLASGNPPDMWQTHGWSLKRYSDFLVNLKNEPWAKSLNPALDPVMLSDKGDLYAFPIDVDVAGILYNGDVLAKVGAKAEDIKTWPEFYKVADAITKQGLTAIHVAGKDRWPIGNFIDWMIPGELTPADYKSFENGTLVKEKYGKIFDQLTKFRKKGYFNADFSSATADDNSRALALNQAGFVFLTNFIAVGAYSYKPDANVQFMPIPSDNGSPYFVVGEKNAIGISNKSKYIKICKEYLSFLAKKDNLSVLATSAGAVAGLVNTPVKLGKLSKSWSIVEKTRSVPYFDRVYMPSGSWDSIVATAEGVATDTMSKKEALDKIISDFNSLYKAQHKGQK